MDSVPQAPDWPKCGRCGKSWMVHAVKGLVTKCGDGVTSPTWKEHDAYDLRLAAGLAVTTSQAQRAHASRAASGRGHHEPPPRHKTATKGRGRR